MTASPSRGVWPPDDEWGAPFRAHSPHRCDGCADVVRVGETVRRHRDDGDVRHDDPECLKDDA